MPITVSYPGVYIEEIPSGVHTITGVATSITAFIGAAQRGPVNDPISVFSYGDFQRTFGGMTSDVLPGTTVPLYSVAFAVNDFFLNGGSQAVIVRVVATATGTNGSSGTSSASTSSSSSTTPAPSPAVAATILLTPVLSTSASSSLSSSSSSAEPSSVGASSSSTSAASGAATALTLAASSQGSWGNNLTAIVDLQTRDKTKNYLFNLTVNETDPVTKQIVNSEHFYNLSTLSSDSTYVVSYLEQNSQLVISGAIPQLNPPAPAPPANPTDSKNKPIPYFASGGLDGSPITSSAIFDPSLEDAKQGIYALDNTDIFNLMVIPPFKSPMDADIDLGPLITQCATYCKSRRAFLVIDPPDLWDNPNPSLAFTNFIEHDLTSFRTAAGIAASYVAIFYPRLKKPNPMMSNQIQVFPTSGTIAGLFANTDAQRGVWKAPAGIDAALTGASSLTVTLNNGENGQLNQIGVNCLRTFPIIGSVVWGSRTLNGADVLADDYKYIPVRRFVLFLEESLYRGTQWVVFEPNDEPLWASIRLNVGAFMQTLFRQGAFQGSSASQAYFVKCDDETTTQNDINNGIVNIIVGFAPLKPAEFVVLQIQQIAGAIQT
jgi:phage tail sheath protein FI